MNNNGERLYKCAIEMNSRAVKDRQVISWCSGDAEIELHLDGAWELCVLGGCVIDHVLGCDPGVAAVGGMLKKNVVMGLYING